MEKRKAYPEQIEKIGENSVRMIRTGAVRDHKLGNNAREHTGEVEENESFLFSDFLITRNCGLVLDLRGSDNA